MRRRISGSAGRHAAAAPADGNARMRLAACAAGDACVSEAVVAIAARAFWVFVVCSVAGLLIEELYHLAVFHELQDRAGLLFGPFSPIYGIGGLAVFALSRVARVVPLPAAFCIFAAAGGAVEFAASFVLENAFGIVAWDYSDTFLSVGGRTNGYFMLMWGVLGVACMRLLVPVFDRAIMPALERIPPWATGVFAAFMAANVALTLVSFNCWYHRLDGNVPETPVQVACAAVFDDEFMADRFQTMSLDPADAAR